MERNRKINSEILKMKINLEFLILLNVPLVFPRQLLPQPLNISPRIAKYYT